VDVGINTERQTNLGFLGSHCQHTIVTDWPLAFNKQVMGRCQKCDYGSTCWVIRLSDRDFPLLNQLTDFDDVASLASCEGIDECHYFDYLTTNSYIRPPFTLHAVLTLDSQSSRLGLGLGLSCITNRQWTLE
jgi:hypothetical protein